MLYTEYLEARQPMVDAVANATNDLAVWDAEHPAPPMPPGEFALWGIGIDRSNPELPGLNLKWYPSSDATGYFVKLLDASLNHIMDADVGNVLELENAFAGQFEGGGDFYVVVRAVGNGDDREWSNGQIHFSV